MTLPTGKIANIAISSMWVYPWAGGGAAVYDATTGEKLTAIQSATVTITDTLAELFGAESAYLLEAETAKTEVDIKMTAAKLTLRALQIVRGGTFLMNAATTGMSATPEVQYYVADLEDRADYCRVVLESKIGGGILTLTYARCKCQGSTNLDMKSESYLMPDLNVKATYDETFVREDDGVGGIFTLKFVKGKVPAVYASP